MFQEELQRVLSSEALKQSASLRRLLEYLGRAHERGEGRLLKEYSIGRDVMGKPENYDPRRDSSVRVQIGKLRAKLDQYYQSEGAASVVRIHLPKGGFELGIAERQPDPRPELPRWTWVALAAAAGLAAGLLWNRPGATGFDRDLDAFWRPFLASDNPLTVVLGSPLFIRFHSSYYRDPWVNDWNGAGETLPLADMQRLLKSPSAAQPTFRWAPFGESSAAFRLALVLGPRRPDMSMKRSTVLSWEDVRSANLIFLGPPKFNRQLSDLPVPADFVVENGGVTNRRPRPGEAAVYRRTSPANVEDIPEDYALITRIRAANGWGEVLVLESSSTEGTWAAADYVTDAATVNRLNKLADSARAYQVLIKAKFRHQVPVGTEYVTHHVLDDRPPLPAQTSRGDR